MYKTVIILFQLLFFVYFVIVVTKLFFIVTLLLFAFIKCYRKTNLMVPPLNWTYLLVAAPISYQPHACWCGRRYRLKKHLQYHQRNECSREPTFLCQFCPYKAKRKWNLGVHLQKLHFKSRKWIKKRFIIATYKYNIYCWIWHL